MAQEPDITRRSTASQVLEDLVDSIDITSDERGIQHYQRPTRVGYQPLITSLGFQNEVEFGLGIFKDSFYWPRNILPDHDEHRAWVMPRDQPRFWDGIPSMSLHQINQVPLSNGESNQSHKRLDGQKDYSVVFSRCFLLGDLLTRHQGEDVWSDTDGSLSDFVVVRALGPITNKGFWIMARPKVREDDELNDEEHIETDYEPPWISHLTEEKRASRIAKPPGFPNKIAYARIKEHTPGRQFELEDQATNEFVLSSQILISDVAFENE
ncbi:MAG: hypothetical protein M1821_002598 [Bathelium mastoideum]|nr:MAG: hypothetical protein M1821_002598 [Bathelium mastoideum]